MTFKPYRLINDLELNALQQMFKRKIQAWNDDYALFPMTCILGHITNPTEPRPSGSGTVDLSIIKHALFGDESDCFNSIAETLFIQLFGTSYQLPEDDWFYPGSPTLTLTLTCAGKSTTLYLSPQWVLDALPPQTITRTPPVKLHEALAPQPVHLNVELKPITLKLADIMRLQIGNVIKTDHPITDPAQLTHQQQPICNVDLGASNSFKTIQITRPS